MSIILKRWSLSRTKFHFALVKPVTVTVNFQDMHMMRETVEGVQNFV